MSPMKLLGHAQFHGANRLADKTSRWFWAPALLVLLGPAIMLVMLTIRRYQDNPTYMTQIDSVFRVRRFPSVILCPEVNFVEEKMDQFLAQVKFPPGMNSTQMREILPQLAAFYSLDVLYNLRDLMRVEELLDYNGMDVDTAGKFLTATCEETAIRCRFSQFMINCSDIFHMEFTGDGFCCVFNGRSLRREMEKYGTNIEKTQPHSHWYTKWFGYTSGLMVAVNQSQKPTIVDLSYKWVALQTSQHFVDMSMNGTALNPGSEQWLAFYTKGFQINLGARALKPELRKCTMSTDRLRYFPEYLNKYCLLEKEMENVLKKCKCVRASHPKPPGAQRCRAAMLQCSYQALVSSSTECPMTCDVENTFVLASSFKLDESVKTVEPFYKGLDFKRVSVVRVFIQSRKRQTLERWSYYSYLDLFSQIGGMFSVFFGCSILTMLALLHLGWRVAATQWRRLRN